MSRSVIVIFTIFLTFATGCDPFSSLEQNLNEQGKGVDLMSLSQNKTVDGIEAVQSKTFPGNTRVKFSLMGLSFVIPAQWKGQLFTEAFVMTHKDNVAKIVVMPDKATKAQSLESMSNTIDMGDGIFFQPNSQITKLGNFLMAEYQILGTNQPSVGYIVKAFADNGGGYVLVSLAAADKLDILKSAASEIVQSMKFFTKEEANSTNNIKTNNNGNYWATQLAGLRLTYFYTTSGYREKFVIVLCTGGRFSRTSESDGSDSISGFSAAFQKGSDGTWSTEGDVNSGVLQLNYIAGETGSYDIVVKDEGLFLNEDRYFREEASC